MNSLFSELNSKSMINDFDRFRAQFKGNPKQQVQELLNSGRMSQEQFQQLSEMATQFMNMVSRR